MLSLVGVRMFAFGCIRVK